MDTNTLISEVAQLYNGAAAARTDGDETVALEILKSLRDFLTKELAPEAPAAPEKPDEPLST